MMGRQTVEQSQLFYLFAHKGAPSERLRKCTSRYKLVRVRLEQEVPSTTDMLQGLQRTAHFYGRKVRFEISPHRKGKKQTRRKARVRFGHRSTRRVGALALPALN